MNSPLIARVQRRKWVKPMWSVYLGKHRITTEDNKAVCAAVAAAINEALLATHFAAIRSTRAHPGITS